GPQQGVGWGRGEFGRRGTHLPRGERAPGFLQQRTAGSRRGERTAGVSSRLHWSEHILGHRGTSRKKVGRPRPEGCGVAADSGGWGGPSGPGASPHVTPHRSRSRRRRGTPTPAVDVDHGAAHGTAKLRRGRK